MRFGWMYATEGVFEVQAREIECTRTHGCPLEGGCGVSQVLSGCA